MSQKNVTSGATGPMERESQSRTTIQSGHRRRISAAEITSTSLRDPRSETVQSMDVETEILCSERFLTTETGSDFPFPKTVVTDYKVLQNKFTDENANAGEIIKDESNNGNVDGISPDTNNNIGIVMKKPNVPSASSSGVSVSTTGSFDMDGEEAVITDGETPYFDVCDRAEVPPSNEWGYLKWQESKDEIEVPEASSDEDFQYDYELPKTDRALKKQANPNRFEVNPQGNSTEEKMESDAESTASDVTVIDQRAYNNLNEIDLKTESDDLCQLDKPVNLEDVEESLAKLKIQPSEINFPATTDFVYKYVTQEYKMSYYPFWLRPDGRNTLAEVPINLFMKKVDDVEGTFYSVTVAIKNIAKRDITFHVQTCDDTKYDIKPQIGVLKVEGTVDCTIRTKKPNEWTFVDLMHDSVRVLASTFVGSADLDEEIPVELEFKAVSEFWGKYGTPDFPFAELYYISGMAPLEASYFDDESLSKTAMERFQSSCKFLLPISGKNMYKTQRKPDGTGMYMLFADFSKDPGDLFVRDQVRSIVVNRDRLNMFALGKVYNLRNLMIVAGASVAFLGITWLLKKYFGQEKEPESWYSGYF